LKTNDTTLLETCFHTTDLGTIRATIERLDSALAAALLKTG
jgi:U3 small nucleolar RNA-associated protein 5